MLIEIKYVEASELLWDMFRELPEDAQKRFSERVDKVSSALDHPSLGFSHVVATVGSDRTCEPPVRSGGIVLPLQRAEVTDGKRATSGTTQFGESASKPAKDKTISANC